MSANKKWIVPLAKCAVLLLGAWGLYVLWHKQIVTPLNVVDDDDISVAPRVSVHVGTITLATLHQYLSADGTVEAEPARGDKPAAIAVITTPGPSLIADVECKEGQHVQKGETLFTVDGLTGEAGSLKFTAPLAGTVVQLAIHPGEVTTQYSAALQVVDLNRLVVAVALPASQLSDVKVGQSAQIFLASTTTTAPSLLAGSVTFVDPGVDPRTDMGSVDISILADSGLRLGQFIHVAITTDEHHDCLAVPADSISNDSQGRASIGVVVRDFRWAVRQPVQVGLSEGGMVEIHGADLKPGVDIVTTGAYALPDKSRIEVDR
jgi:multidrug efflux pump subunit AcrA (membrane-fusion protein)